MLLSSHDLSFGQSICCRGIFFPGIFIQKRWKKLPQQIFPTLVVRDRTGLSDSDPNKIVFP
jgi:hypothetical protein